MNSSGDSSTVRPPALEPSALDAIGELILQSTPESLEQAALRLDALREQLATGLDGRRLSLTGAEANHVRRRLSRMRESALRGDQMISGRLQLVHGPDLLYDRRTGPPANHFPSRVHLEG